MTAGHTNRGKTSPRDRREIVARVQENSSTQGSAKQGVQPKPKKAVSKTAQRELSLLHLIHSNHNPSRIQLAKQTGASAGSMTTIVQRLITRGLVVESGKGTTNSGRKPVSLSLRHDLAYVVGVDLGSFFSRVIITDILGNICYRSEAETKMAEGREQVLSRTFRAIHTAIGQSQIPRGAIKGIGMAHSGVVDSQS